MQTRPFGTTGLSVPVLGLGTAQVGSPDVPEANAARLLNRALDEGLTLIDTAHCYGISEERIGRHLAGRRDEYVLSSKCGHQLEGYDDWTPAIVRASVELSLQRMRTDHIDVLHLHSCDKEDLLDGSLADTMQELKDEGKIGVVAYSGDNAALAHAVSSGRFAAVEASVSIADQWNLHHVLGEAAASGLGVIAKRPIANGIWRHAERPTGVYGDSTGTACRTSPTPPTSTWPSSRCGSRRSRRGSPRRSWAPPTPTTSPARSRPSRRARSPTTRSRTSPSGGTPWARTGTPAGSS